MRFFGLSLLCVLACGAASADDSSYDSYQGIGAGLFIPDSARNAGNGLTLDAFYGIPFGDRHAFEIEGFGASSSRNSGGSDSFVGLDAGINWGRREAGNLFLRASAGGVQERTAAGSDISPLVGLGIGYYPRYDDPRDLLRLELRWNGVFSDAVADKSMLSDFRLMVGLMVGGAPKARLHPDPLAAAPREPDADNDGVPDSRDRCADTPRWQRPDARGCPLPAAAIALLDSDHDGVPDSDDKCPDTPTLNQADENGCVEVQQLSLYNIHFELDSSELGYEDRQTALALAGALKGNLGTVVEVAGFTDPVGPRSYNKALSMRRAEAVRDFLIGLGVNPAQLQIGGYGIASPSAKFPKDRQALTDDARARRVEFRVLEQ